MASIGIVPRPRWRKFSGPIRPPRWGLFQRYHVGGCESCSYKPTVTLEEVRRNFNIQDSLDEIANVIRESAEVPPQRREGEM